MPQVPSDHSPTTKRTPASRYRAMTAASGPHALQTSDRIPAAPGVHIGHAAGEKSAYGSIGGSKAW